jgi:hypothetical protein
LIGDQAWAKAVRLWTGGEPDDSDDKGDR